MRTFASQFVETVSVSMSLITKHLCKSSCIKVSSARAIFMNGASEGKHRTPFCIQRRQFAERCELKDGAEESVRIRWATRNCYDRFFGQNLRYAPGFCWIRIGRRNAAEGSAGSDRNDRGRLIGGFLKHFQCRLPPDFAVNAAFFGRNRAFYNQYILAGIGVHCAAPRIFGLVSGGYHHGFVIVERNEIEYYFSKPRMAGSE